jgi:hypothetical protein
MNEKDPGTGWCSVALHVTWLENKAEGLHAIKKLQVFLSYCSRTSSQN